MSPDPHQKLILTFPGDRRRQIKMAAGEATQVLTYFLTVEPHGRSELGFVNLQ